MAILNIENFPDSLYKKIQERARRENRSLSEEVVRILNRALDMDEFQDQEKTLSILGLKGLGKEIWEGIDAAEYIRAERDSWEDDEDSPVTPTE
jgi:plasmid stability protein